MTQYSSRYDSPVLQSMSAIRETKPPGAVTLGQIERFNVV